MKEYWQEATLNDICIIERGSSPRPIKKFITTGADGVNWIKIGDTKNINKYIFSTNQKITKEGALQSRYVKVGDFIISNSMSYGRPYILKTDGYIHDGWFVLRLDKKLIDENYLYYLLSSNFAISQYDELASGSIVKNINSDLIKQVKFLLPHLTEQKRIVKILDKAFEDIEKIKENAKQNLQNSRDLFQSYLNKLFTENTENWEEKTLDAIGLIQTGTTPKTNEKNNFGNYIPFIKPSDFNGDGTINYNSNGLSKIGITKSRLIKKNSVLMVCIGATIGKTGYIQRDITCNQQINTITPYKDFYKFLYYSMLTESFQKKILIGCPQTTLPIINKTNWSNLTAKLPKITFQKQIVKKLDMLQEKTKKLEEIYNKKLQLAEELKQSILHKAFNGDL